MNDADVQPTWDREIVTEASVDDLDPELIEAFLKKERAHAPRAFGQLSDTEALCRAQVLGRDVDGKPRPTLGGLLALGIYPQQFFPRLTVTFSAYPGLDKTSDISGKRFLDNVTLAGSIPYLVNDAVKRVVANMRTGGIIRGAFRKDLPDYPPVAVREAVANALMHRDYSPRTRGSQVQVNMYVDRLEVVNPGGLYGPVTLDSLRGGNAIAGSRNPILSRLLESTPYPGGGYVAENRGSGYQEIERQQACEMLPPPLPIDRPEMFSLTFSRREDTPGERHATVRRSSHECIVDYLRAHRMASTKELADSAGIGVGGARKVIYDLISQGLIERIEPLRSPRQRYRLATQPRRPVSDN